MTPDGSVARAAGRAALAFLVGFLVPGAGYAAIGRVAKGLLLGGSVAVVFLAGMLIGGPSVVSLAHKPIWFLGHVWGGGCTGLAWVLGRPDLAADPDAAHELGVLYTCVAALCNFLLMLDGAASGWRDVRPLAEPEAPDAKPAPGTLPGAGAPA